MSFSNSLSTDVGMVRMHLGDDVQNAGVLPDASNMSDEQIQALLTQESDDVMRAVAASCEVLALRYARAVSTSIGQRRQELQQIFEHYSQTGKALRAQYGGDARAFSIAFERVDAYSTERTDGLTEAEEVEQAGAGT